MSFNKVIIMGNLTKDPELRQTQMGTHICRFTIAMNRTYSAQDGSQKDEACFIDVDCFGKTAENVSKYFSKGKPILVEGRLRQDTWEDKQSGQKRSKILVVMERFEFVGNAAKSDSYESSSSDYDSRAPQTRSSKRPMQNDNVDDLEDDDVPF